MCEEFHSTPSVIRKENYRELIEIMTMRKLKHVVDKIKHTKDGLKSLTADEFQFVRDMEDYAGIAATPPAEVEVIPLQGGSR